MSGPARAGAEQLVLGRYRLLQRLGSGGFGEVWRAEDTQLGRQVAVKRIHAGADLDADLGGGVGGEAGGAGRRSEREAQAVARLSHPAIVALYEAAREEQAWFLISELVEGATLAELIAEDALDDSEIIEIGLALCDALAHAHARGVIHRDVKPQNILVPDEPPEGSAAAKLTDFGGAKLDGEEALTRTGDVLGTLAYMAPEQSDGDPARPESDLYSLALVLYEALSGENPVRAGTPAATARRIGSRLASLRRLRRDLPRPLTAAIDACLRPDPAGRGRISDLADALGLALGELSDASAEQAHDQDAEEEDTTVWHGQETLRVRDRRGRLRPQSALTAVRGRRARASTAPAAGDSHRGEPVPAWTPPQRPTAPRVRPDAAGLRAMPAAVPAGADPEDRGAAPRSDPGSRAPARPGPLALPRGAWALLLAAAVIWQTAAGRPGLALVALAGAAPLIVVMPTRAGPLWLAAALAPALGLAGLAAAYPALAGRPASPRMRLALGGVGFWWLGIGELILARSLPPAPAVAGGLAAHSGSGAALAAGGRLAGGAAGASLPWESSLSGGAHALGALLSGPVAAGVALWAVGAVVLPWVVRGSDTVIDTILALAWSAALLLGPALLAGAVRGAGPVGLAETAGSAVVILAAVLGALIAVGTRRLAQAPRAVS